MDNLGYVAGAYGFFWVVFVGYLWSLRSRQQRLEREHTLLIEE